MTAYQNGDVAAFAELVARHEAPLWNYLRRFVKSPEAAEDLLQETFLRVIKKADEWKPSAKFSTWLYTIARNLTIDHARSMTHRGAISLDGAARAGAVTGLDMQGDMEGALHERVSAKEPGAEQRALDRELAGQLEQAIARLPEPQREVFVMREVLGLPFAEIALAVGTSEATIKSRMRYALERLRSELAGLDSPATVEVAT
jgi:RNA polymerase sigma-70 factor (ECF subfamily)